MLTCWRRCGNNVGRFSWNLEALICHKSHGSRAGRAILTHMSRAWSGGSVIGNLLVGEVASITYDVPTSHQNLKLLNAFFSFGSDGQQWTPSRTVRARAVPSVYGTARTISVT